MSGFRGGARGAECLNSQAALDKEMVMEPLQAQSPPPPPADPGSSGEAKGSSICPSEMLLKVSP